MNSKKIKIILAILLIFISSYFIIPSSNNKDFAILINEYFHLEYKHEVVVTKFILMERTGKSFLIVNMTAEQFDIQKFKINLINDGWKEELFSNVVFVKNDLRIEIEQTNNCVKLIISK